jgi:hypothetical protein
LKSDALALLKAQEQEVVNLTTKVAELQTFVREPRVMTLEEAHGADYCWYESRTANICILCDATMYPNLNGKPKTELQTMGTAVRGWQYDDAYGKDWRCWDKEPTKEQREAEPWE